MLLFAMLMFTLMNKFIRRPITEAFLCVQFIFCTENNETTVAHLCHAFLIHHVYATYTTHIQHILLLLSAFPIRGRHSGFSISSYSYIFCILLSTSAMSSFTTSINLLFGLPRFLVPGNFILSILLPLNPSSFPRTCPYHLSLASCPHHLSQSTHSQHTPCILNIHHVHSTYTKYVHAPCTLNIH